uniref:Pherophorin-C6 protein n=1 Tax=Chlamydomonas reinhardtii TaxID=3055 RepID=Q3HTK1_CHLRE|nr:pherophorin-C6 protein precursor [Chlamydomonas reinhardtii]
MRLTVAVLAILALAIGASAQQTGLYPSFPYCQCTKTPSAYRLSPTVTSTGAGTYCFTLSANKVPAGCTHKCCKADLKKIEFNVNDACDVFSPSLKATINGVRTKVAPAINKAQNGPVGSTTLVLTQLGLGLGNDGAQVCITLGLNKNGKGCTTLEELCVPPAGMPAGVCTAALFDSQNDCCPLSQANVPSPPPPSPPPPSPPPRCEVCAYIALVDPENNAPFPYAFSADECDSYAQTLIDDITAQAGDAGATIVTPFAKVDCQERLIKVCGEFFSNEEGALIQDWIGEQVSVWNDMVTGGQCPAYLSGYSVVTAVGGDGSDVNSLPMSCLNAFKSTACAPETVDFPKCQCTTKAFATPFAVKPMMSEMAGPSKDTTSYCFELAVVAPANPGSACGKTSTVNKAEFFADDTKRRQIKSIGIKPAGAAGYKWVAPSWGAVGDQTLKVTLGWSTAQAAGGRICLELYNTTSLDDFCMGAAMDTCWLNLFDTTRNCCPLYTSSLV